MNEKQRKKHNEKIIRKMKRGEPLNTVAPQSTWFPPRPTIKKDEEAIKKLYKIEQKKKGLHIVEDDQSNEDNEINENNHGQES